MVLLNRTIQNNNYLYACYLKYSVKANVKAMMSDYNDVSTHLRFPEEVEASGPLGLTALHVHGGHEDDNHHQPHHVRRNHGAVNMTSSIKNNDDMLLAKINAYNPSKHF